MARSRGGQCGFIFDDFLRGVFQEASGGVFFEILCEFGDQWVVYWGLVGPFMGVQMRGRFLGNLLGFLGSPLTRRVRVGTPNCYQEPLEILLEILLKKLLSTQAGNKTKHALGLKPGGGFGIIWSITSF